MDKSLVDVHNHGGLVDGIYLIVDDQGEYAILISVINDIEAKIIACIGDFN
jgi:hypothetical protein